MILFWTKPMSSSEYTPRIRAHIIIVIIYSICKVNLTFFVLIRYACNTFCMKIWILVFEWNIAKARRSLEWKLITVHQHYHVSLDVFKKFGNSIIRKCVISCSYILDKTVSLVPHRNENQYFFIKILSKMIFKYNWFFE